MFSEIPFLKLFLALSIGVILSVFFGLDLNIYSVLISFSVLFIIHQVVHRQLRLIPYFGLALLSFVIIVGLFRGTEQKQKARNTVLNSEAYVLGKISKAPKMYDKFVKTNLEIVAIKGENGFRESDGKSLLMIEKDSLSLNLKKGDYMQFEPEFKQIDANNNPETFNYKRYLFFHLISQQTYLKSNNWTKVEVTKSWLDLDRISDLRSYLLQQYQAYGIDGNELSVLSALTLGYKNDLDNNIQKSYAASGAIHVLAVSGLHVGIVFVIISHLLKLLGRKKLARLLRFVLTVLFIWLFAFLTGGAPSVLRASLMFSFIALGQALNKTGTIYNSIFASAFLLLLYNPFLLFDLSFQLSYSAVLSIVFFQPKIYSWISVRHFIPKWIWGLTSVSLAAQIGTLPITIFYFHQFPNYFLLSNFIVIPLATLIIWLSILFFMSLSFDLIAQTIAYILQKIIFFQNYLIQKIESLPYSLSQDLYIDAIQLFVLILIVLSLMQFAYKLKFKYGVILGSLVLIFMAYSDFRIFNQQSQKKLIVYNIKGFTVLNLIDGDDNILISSLKEQSKQKDYHLSQNWLSLGLEKEKHIRTNKLNERFALSNLLITSNPNFYSKNEFIQFYDKRILYIQDKSILSKFRKEKLDIDYIIIGKNIRIDISELDLYFSAKQIIIDSSHSQRNLQFWKTQKAINPSKNIYLVSEKGAFVEDIILSKGV